jgi:hypothetical protein
MTMIRRIASAGLLCCAFATTAQAESGLPCPSLPASTGLAWQKLDGADFTFCKAMSADGQQVFAVMLGREAGFKARRSNRVGQAEVDGHAVEWYRGENAGAQALEVRETLVDLGQDRSAHISLRAGDAEAAEAAMRQAESLRFDDPRFTSN